MTEDELIAAALAGAGRLRRFALHLCGDPDTAEDLVQDGLLRALASRKELRDPGLLVPWLFSIIRRAFLDQRRRTEQRTRIAEAKLGLAEPPTGNLEREIVEREFSDEVSRALSGLPEEWRTSILLCDVEGFSYQEIAEALSCPVGTVRSRISRGRAQLLAALRSLDRAGKVEPGVRT
ncbi:MAG TPA: RNA polymerase sigma factor [Myxococcaceae bacterium]|nr:RNA polymerase sigma factor [Myxococcaceae bacterium]